jgi:hypothetical protein
MFVGIQNKTTRTSFDSIPPPVHSRGYSRVIRWPSADLNRPRLLIFRCLPSSAKICVICGESVHPQMTQMYAKIIRIISARQADARERKRHEEENV